DDICKIAGPLKPQCVNKMFSSDEIRVLDTRGKIVLPASAVYQEASFPVMVPGTKPGAGPTTCNPLCSAAFSAQSAAPSLATGKPPDAKTTFLQKSCCSSPSRVKDIVYPSLSRITDFTSVRNQISCPVS